MCTSMHKHATTTTITVKKQNREKCFGYTNTRGVKPQHWTNHIFNTESNDKCSKTPLCRNRTTNLSTKKRGNQSRKTVSAPVLPASNFAKTAECVISCASIPGVFNVYFCFSKLGLCLWPDLCRNYRRQQFQRERIVFVGAMNTTLRSIHRVHCQVRLYTPHTWSMKQTTFVFVVQVAEETCVKLQ